MKLNRGAAVCVVALMAGTAAMTGCSKAGGAGEQAEDETALCADGAQGEQGAGATTDYARWGGGGRAGRRGGGERGGRMGERAGRMGGRWGRGHGLRDGYRHAGGEHRREGMERREPWWRRLWSWGR